MVTFASVYEGVFIAVKLCWLEYVMQIYFFISFKLIPKEAELALSILIRQYNSLHLFLLMVFRHLVNALVSTTTILI